MTSSGTGNQTPTEPTEWDERSKFWVQAAPEGASTNDAPNQLLIQHAGIRAGHRVLDLASGAGEPAISIAIVVAPAGRVTALDVSADMLAGVSRRAASLGLTNIETQQGNLDSLELGDGVYDAATCRFGLMFARDPADALSRVRRSLKPGGRLAVMVHGPPAQNELFTTVRSAVLEFLGKEDDGRAIRRFRFSGEGELTALFRSAGFVDLSEEFICTTDTRPADTAVAENPFWAALLLRGFGAQVTKLSPTDRRRLDDTVRDALAPFRQTDATGDRYEFLSSERIGAGEAPE